MGKEFVQVTSPPILGIRFDRDKLATKIPIAHTLYHCASLFIATEPSGPEIQTAQLINAVIMIHRSPYANVHCLCRTNRRD